MKNHIKKLFLLPVLIAVLGLNFATQIAHAVNTYTVIGLTTNNSRASAINDANVVAGHFGNINNWPVSSNIHALRWQAATGAQDLGTVGYSGWATTINNAGVIAGMGATANYGSVSVFRCPLNSSTLEVLPRLPSGGDADTLSINTAGIIVGFSTRISCCCGDWPCIANSVTQPIGQAQLFKGYQIWVDTVVMPLESMTLQ